jgi:hypothetical protein
MDEISQQVEDKTLYLKDMTKGPVSIPLSVVPAIREDTHRASQKR